LTHRGLLQLALGGLDPGGGVRRAVELRPDVGLRACHVLVGGRDLAAQPLGLLVRGAQRAVGVLGPVAERLHLGERRPELRLGGRDLVERGGELLLGRLELTPDRLELGPRALGLRGDLLDLRPCGLELGARGAQAGGRRLERRAQLLDLGTQGRLATLHLRSIALEPLPLGLGRRLERRERRALLGREHRAKLLLLGLELNPDLLLERSHLDDELGLTRP
jgi:hypothetical protein